MKKPSERVRKLLSQMTVEEKALQLSCALPAMGVTAGVFDREKAEKNMPKGIGRFTQYSSPFFKGPRQIAEGHNALQKYAIEKSGIPIIIQNESSTGLVAREGTVFPVPIAIASSWQDEYANKMGRVIADEGRAIGAKVMMSPVADIAREGRWGRVGETFGEDPLLAGRFSAEEAKGIQGDDYTRRCAALAKHWVGYGSSEVGINCATINIGKKELFEVYATPFAAAIKEADMQGIMVTYSDIDGRPMSVNEEYTQKILRQDLGFNGTAVCDGHSIPRVIDIQGLFENREELASYALKAGIDADTPTTTVYNHIVSGVEQGIIDEKDLDECVLRILQQKEEFGLFDDPFVDPDKAVEVFADPEADRLSEEIAEKSIILLKNKDNILPLKQDLKKIAVIGPFGSKLSAMFGGYAYPLMMTGFLGMLVDPQEKSKMEGFADMARLMFDVEAMAETIYTDHSRPFVENVDEWLKREYGMITVPDALKNEFSNAEVVYHYGAHNNNPEWKKEVEEAVETARDADVIIMTLGEVTGFGAEATSGEGTNNPDLSLPGHQQALLEACSALNKPVVMVLFNGRALALKDAEPLCDAIVEAWYPGPSAPQVVARVLSGKINPGGKLPVTFPQISSQCPIYYGHLTGAGYMTIKQQPDPTVLQPLYPFGYGLSYTEFRMDNLKADEEVVTGEKFKVSCDVENIGERNGDATVQIYTHSVHPTIQRPIKELRAYKRLTLQPGEKRHIEFTLDTRNFGYFNFRNEFVIEARKQDIYMCSDSSTILEKAEIRFTGRDKEILHDRVFNFETVVE